MTVADALPRSVRMLTVLLVCIALLDARAQDDPGKAAYSRVCQVCHGVEGHGDAGPALVPLEKDADEVLGIVREGIGQMPPISAERLGDDDVRRIVAYLKSLKAAAGSTAATVVTADAIRAVANRSIAERTSDVAIRTIEAAGGHVGIGVIYRGTGHGLRQFSSHDAVTEVYQVLQGSGTIVSGGSLINPQQRQGGSEVVGQLNGPSVNGSGITHGTSQRLTGGDMIIIRPGCPTAFPRSTKP